jgi:chemotaxis protein MotB
LRRKRAQQTHVNHERWLVSYADFITLLFAFFVVMFSSSQNDKSTTKAFSDSVRDALQHGKLSDALTGMMRHGKPGPSTAGVSDIPPASVPAVPHVPSLLESQKILNEKLQAELESGKMQVRLEGRGLVISLREAGFFRSGDNAVDPQSYPVLEKVASVLRAVPNPVRLEGHTDAIPIHTSRFRSNWELSAARAIAMADLLIDRFGIARNRLAVAGYAENAPADTNDTDEGRAHNRRVDVVVLAHEGAKSEPIQGMDIAATPAAGAPNTSPTSTTAPAPPPTAQATTPAPRQDAAPVR